MSAAPQSHNRDDDEVAHSYLEAIRRQVPLRESDGSLSYPTVRARPAPTFTLDPLHRGLLTLSVVVPVLLTVYLATQITAMPAEVPVHFGLDGSVNRYGSPWEGFWTTLGMTAVIIGIAVLARFPRIYNFPTIINSTNVQAQYKNAVQMMVWLNLSMAILTVGMLSIWFGLTWLNLVWVGLALMLAVMVVFIRRMFKLR